MDFIIRSIDFTATGREIIREREASSKRLTIGRASENDIHLADLAVEQQHVAIVPQASGALRIEALSTLGFAFEGRNVREATVDAGRTGEIAVGSYRLAIDWGTDGKPVITVQQSAQDDGEGRDRLRGFGLEGALPSRRVMSWVAMAAIIIAFLAVPIWSHMTRERIDGDIDRQGAVLMDASWSTGSLSSVHHGLEDNCEACHVDAFVSVQDETCLTCHEDIADHAKATRMADGRAPFSGGDAVLWQIAQAFNKPGPGACSDCHTEHEGAGRMEATSQQFCADCHDTMDTRLTDTTLGNASDFGKLHPQFKALVVPERGAQPVRLSLDENMRHFDGLKFPHDMHLSTRNGVARMASRLDPSVSGLACADCHTVGADGVSFLPVEMEESCEDCHSLVYDKVGSTFRSLRHGDIQQMEADLRAMDRVARRPVSTGRQRPGQFAQGGRYYSNFGRAAPGGLTRAAMRNDGMCGECHYPAQDASGALAVVPVTQQERWFQHGWFDHEPHKQEKCITCHEAGTSDDATDLLMPDLASCRDCHMGEAAVKADVPSSCAMCHSYHPREGPDAAPPRFATAAR